MVRALALLALPLLVAGCGSSSTTARSTPQPTIDSYRSAYFGQQPSASQVAAIPTPAAGEASAGPVSPARAARGTNHPADQSAALPEPAEAAAAPSKPAAPPAYKASIAAYIKRYAVDSSSLKLAKIGTPFQGAVNGQKGSVVCVALGGMSNNLTAYLLKDNHVIDSELGAQACQGQHLTPWDNAAT